MSFHDVREEVEELFSGLETVDTRDMRRSVFEVVYDPTLGEMWLRADASERVRLERVARHRLTPPIVSRSVTKSRTLGLSTGYRSDVHAPAIDRLRVIELASLGLSLRAIERRTGVGRNRLSRMLRGS